MARKREQLASCGCFPNLGRSIEATAHDSLAIRGERHGKDWIAMPFELDQLPAVGRGPHSSGVIPTSADNALAVRRKRHGPDRAVMPC